MALKNSVTDLDGTARAAVISANLAGVAYGLAGTATVHADEASVFPALVAALRGRGINNPLAILLAAYDSPMAHPQFSITCARQCAAVPGTLDESRTQEGV